MLDFSVLINSTDPSFKIKAFNEYCQAKQANFELVMALLTDTISEEEEESVKVASYGSSVGYTLDLIKKKIQDYDLNPDSQILVQSGYIKLYDLVSLLKEVVNDDSDSSVSFYTPKFPVHNATGSVVKTLSYEEIAGEMAASLHAMTALVAANKAVQAESTADALTVFRDEIQTKFANSYADISNTAATLKRILEDTRGNAAAYFQNLSAAMSIPSLAADDSTTVPEDDNFSKYSGASPSACLCSGISKAGEIVVGAINTAAKVVGGILTGIFNIGKSLFNKARNWIHDTVVDPKDLKYSNDAEASTIDGFCFESNDDVLVGLPTGCSIDKMMSLVQPYVNSWLGFDTYYSSILLRINRITQNADGLVFTIDSKIKPKTVSQVVFEKLIAASSGTGEKPLSLFATDQGINRYTVSNAQMVYDLVSDYSAYGPDDLNDSATEDQLFSSLVSSLAMTNIICKAAVMKNNLNVNYIESAFYVSNMDTFKTALGGQIRNCDFISVASGFFWEGTPDNWSKSTSPTFSGATAIRPSLSNGSWTFAIAPCLIQLFAAHLYEEDQYPLDFAFFPYTNNTWSLPSSKWAVATDKDNSKAFETFATVATLAIITIAVTATAAVVVKKISNALTKRALQRKSVLDQKMWNGEPLTKKEWKQYKRANKRCNASALLNGGLQETGANVSNSSTLNSDNNSDILSNIKTLITG